MEEEAGEIAAAAARVAAVMVLVVLSWGGDWSSPCKEGEDGGQDKETKTREIPVSSSAAEAEALAVLEKDRDSLACQDTVFCWKRIA